MNLSIANFEQVSNPSMLLLITEPGRALIELGKYFNQKEILDNAPIGDGHPVVVLPGFMTSDKSTFLLRKFIRECGYACKKWGLGRNLGQYEDPMVIAEPIQKVYEQYGQKVSLIGWSLGGIYAREVARHFPEAIRQVITLGSPFQGVTKTNNAKWLYELIHNKKVSDINPDLLKDMHLTPPVPCTAIYSKSDGVVPWQYCMEEATAGVKAQNIEVKGSHWGLGYNPAVLLCIANRLAQSPKEWQPFKPQGRQRLLYPSLFRRVM